MTVTSVFATFTAAPSAVRRVVIVAWVMLAAQGILAMVYTYLTYRQLSVAMQSYDVFNPTSLSIELGTTGSFIAGVSVSFPATFGGFAALCATRLLRPYRPKARQYVFVGAVAHSVLVVATVAGVLIGNRAWDAKTIGTVLSVVFVIPLVPLSAHRVVKAWSVPLPLPRPPLPPDA